MEIRKQLVEAAVEGVMVYEEVTQEERIRPFTIQALDAQIVRLQEQIAELQEKKASALKLDTPDK